MKNTFWARFSKFTWIPLNAFGGFSILLKNHESLISTRTGVCQKIHSKGEILYWLSIISYSAICLSKSILVNRRRKLQDNPEKDDDCGSLTPSEWMTGTERQYCQRKRLHITFIILPKPAHQKKSKRNSKFGLVKRIFHLNFETKTLLLPNIAKLCWDLTWKIKSSNYL